MDSSRLVIDARKGKLLFGGDCSEVLELCQAMCCRTNWILPISMKEFQSGMYDAESVCMLTNTQCWEDVDVCTNMRYQLKKKEDGSCAHLDSNNRCSIYDRRPQNCRNFSCRGGWRLDSVFPSRDKKGDSSTESTQSHFIKSLTGDMIFVSHPLLRLLAVFHLKKRQEIVFVKQMAGQCSRFSTQDRFDNAELNDEHLLGLIRLFDRKCTLEQTYAHFCDQYTVKLGREEFNHIVWLLNKHNIILNTGNLRGLLRGMGSTQSGGSLKA